MRVELSVVTPMKDEQSSLEYYFTHVIEALNRVSDHWEIICVDDGSCDGTLALLLKYHQQYPQIKILQLSRNFGKEYALTAGLHYCQGEAVIPLDADMQDPPQLIPELVEKWRQGYDVVLAQRKSRYQDGFIKRASANGFYKLMSMISHSPIYKNSGDFRLMDRKVVVAIRQMPERVRFMKGILSWPGFTMTSVSYDRSGRVAGKSCWRPLALFRLALDGLFSFSDFPIKLVTISGCLISLLSVLYGLFLFIRTLVVGIDVPGYASLMTVILFVSGVQLISLGIIGEYVGRIYLEAKNRPLYVVAETWGFAAKATDDSET
ncbi:MAG: glycosyltransferase family 2 protein [Gammaproteobacteria bacterium]|nr:glycosyltransferase family 2 protein [Gammaproteobacteria bacterium]